MTVEQAMGQYFERLATVWRDGYGTSPVALLPEGADTRICITAPDEDGWVQWRPVRKDKAENLGSLETVIGASLHGDVKAYWNAYWFLTLGGKVDGLSLELMPVVPGVGIKDFEQRTKEYVTAHSRRAGEEVPIGLESNGMLIVLRNSDGTVLLEDFERGRFQAVASSLTDLLLRIQL